MAIIDRFVYSNVHSGDKKVAFEKVGTRLFYITEDYDFVTIKNRLRKRSGVFVIHSARGRRLAKLELNIGRRI